MISLLWLIIIFLIAIPFIPEKNQADDSTAIIGVFILYGITGMLIWILLDTKYHIKESKLFYCSGPIRGSIKITNIRKVERWNKWHVTSFLKPALGNDGLIIHYDKFDDIYTSPKNREAFITALREINPDIEVI
ncbi:PH domain-containing protein [Flavobacterium sp. SM2513]|uniref:PH domain-containing protein n=1 Tax=Flavobacterium sp. SM2513 TaxID=3424766 RepID=UPI003D7F47B9